MTIFTRPLLVARTIARKDGTYGPHHDPYSFTDRIVTVERAVDDGEPFQQVKLHSGLGTRLYVDGREITNNETLAHWAFETLTGLTVEQFDKAYGRVHPYFDDPIKGWM